MFILNAGVLTNLFIYYYYY